MHGDSWERTHHQDCNAYLYDLPMVPFGSRLVDGSATLAWRQRHVQLATFTRRLDIGRATTQRASKEGTVDVNHALARVVREVEDDAVVLLRRGGGRQCGGKVSGVDAMRHTHACAV